MLKEEKGFCYSCNDDVEYSVFSAPYKAMVKGVAVSITRKYCVCNKCGDAVYVESIEKENEVALFDAYKRAVGLLTSEEMRSIRKRYHLSAASFAKVLGLGEKTITRYENGSIQSKEVDLLIRLAAIGENMLLISRLYKNEAGSFYVFSSSIDEETSVMVRSMNAKCREEYLPADNCLKPWMQRKLALGGAQ